MEKIRHFSVWFLIAGLVLGGCGYSRKTVLPRNIKTVYVETVKNKLDVEKIYAYQPGLEMDITNAIIRRLETDGTVKVAEQKNADAILKTDLVQFEQEGLRFNQLEEIKEYRLFIVVKLKLMDARTGDLIWEEPNFTGDNEYYVTDVSSIGEQRAAQEAIQRLARNVVDRIVEDW